MERDAMQYPPVKDVLGYIEKNYSGRTSIKVRVDMVDEGLETTVDVYRRVFFSKRHVASVTIEQFDGKPAVKVTTTDPIFLSQEKLDEILRR